MSLSRAQPRRYLIIPGAPTPNGPLHLGHIAGPYLRADILARRLRRDGHRVLVISGSDPYESYILAQAEREGTVPATLARRCHARITEDFLALDIALDAFIDPLAPTWHRAFAAQTTATVQHFVRAGDTFVRRERILYCPDTDRYVTGCWLAGRCPDCGSAMRGFFCEDCGAHVQPDSLREPQAALNGGSLERRDVPGLFLRLRDVTALLRRLEDMAVPAALIRTALRYIDREGPVLRLTVPGHWGVPWAPTDAGVPQVIFSYAALFSYALQCGAVYAELTGSRSNAFAPDSGVTTIRTFGVDATVPVLLGVVGGALTHGGVKPLDHVMPNYFLHLGGEKFSTSRGHAIWVRDILANTPVASDMLRYHLAQVSPERQPTNLDVGAFVASVNRELLLRLQPRVQRQLEQLEQLERLRRPAPDPSDGVMAEVDKLLRGQAEMLAPASCSVSMGAGAINAWVERGEQGLDGYWWLKGLALIAFPVMPRLATALWRALGHSAEPATASFLERPPRQLQLGVPHFRPFQAADLRACLPSSLAP